MGLFSFITKPRQDRERRIRPAELRDGEGPRWFGLYPAIVSDLVDPDAKGRIKVKFPSFDSVGESITSWATLLTPYADDDQGLEILPEVDSQVVVAFEAGDPSRPYIVGACWNGRRFPSEPATSANNLRTLKTRSGSLLQFDDTDGAAKITVSMRSGHKMVMDDAARDTITIEHSNGCKLSINTVGQVTITANATVDINAVMVNVRAGMMKCDGVLQCDTLIASSVVSDSYTPGSGNIW